MSAIAGFGRPVSIDSPISGSPRDASGGVSYPEETGIRAGIKGKNDNPNSIKTTQQDIPQVERGRIKRSAHNVGHGFSVYG